MALVKDKAMSETEHKAYGILTVVMAALTGMLLGVLVMPASNKEHHVQSLSKLDDAMNMIERYYVDDMDRDTLTEQMLAAMLSTLDPHSHYLSADELKREMETMQGGFEGIGIVLHYEGDTACVGQLIAGGPAEKAGLHPGDRLIMVDTLKIAGVGMSNDEIVGHIRGPHNSCADIALQRYGEKSLRHIKVTRDLISTPTIAYSGMLDKTTGYIRLTRFGETSHSEFRTAVKALKRQGMTGLVLDLRGNGGGLLSAAIAIADEFLPGRELIVYTQGDNQRRENVTSKRGGIFCEGRLAIMIDEFSASASEVVSGAVQDNDRGIIIGRRSFGKGLVQRQFELEDGSAIWLTIARYYTPSGRCIQRPYNKGTDEYYSDFLRQLVQESQTDSMLVQITDSTEYRTTGGRLVYGGGGIYPDYVQKLHKDSLLVYYNNLINKGVIEKYAFAYVTQHYPELRKQYASEGDFIRRFQVTDKMYNDMLTQADKKGIRRDPRGIAKYGREMRNMLKALIAESLFSFDTYYRIMLRDDADVTDAVKHLHNSSL